MAMTSCRRTYDHRIREPSLHASLPAADQKPASNRTAGRATLITTPALVADQGLVDRVESALGRLEREGLRIVAARSALICVNALHRAKDEGFFRDDVEIHQIEKLLVGLRAAVPEDLTVVSGKVGSSTYYRDQFQSIDPSRCAVVAEGNSASRHRISGLGTVAFLKDAEAQHGLVALASLVGKWARDLIMNRIVRYHRIEARP